MSLFGSLFTGVSALTAQSNALSMIANNIANTSTIGYKGDNASFSSLVTVSTSGGNYNPGGVKVTVGQTVKQQGLIQGSSSATDVAISGDGFFVVKDSTNTTDQREPLYTRAGNFSEDNLGYLRNASGFYLYGWQLDENGDIPAANADISSTEPVNIAFLNGVASGTSKVELGLNLDSEQSLGATSIEFTDPNDPQELADALNETLGGGWTEDFNISVVQNGNTYAYNVQITDGQTLNDVINTINTLDPLTATPPSPAPTAGVTASLVNNQMVVNPTNVNDQITIANATLGTPITSLFGAAAITQLGYDFQRTVRIYDSLGASRDIALNFKKQTVNQWLVEARTDPTYVLAVDRTTGLPDPLTGDDGFIGQGTLTFNNDGSLSTVIGALASAVNIPWDGAISGAGNQAITFDFGIDSAGNPTNGAVTQFASDYNVAFVNQNGAALGQRSSITIDEDGYVVASFSNGEFKRLYKLPIATFSNPNGLQARTGNVYAQTTDSGQYNLREAGKGGAGIVQGSSLEQSNIDLGDEFTKMIVTQRAYSAGTKVIRTSDDMLQELMQLR